MVLATAVAAPYRRSPKPKTVSHCTRRMSMLMLAAVSAAEGQRIECPTERRCSISQPASMNGKASQTWGHRSVSEPSIQNIISSKRRTDLATG